MRYPLTTPSATHASVAAHKPPAMAAVRQRGSRCAIDWTDDTNPQPIAASAMSRIAGTNAWKPKGTCTWKRRRMINTTIGGIPSDVHHTEMTAESDFRGGRGDA
jgi:hypothetical protein